MSFIKVNPYSARINAVFEMQNENTAISKSPFQITGIFIKNIDVITFQLDKFTFRCDTTSNYLKATTKLPDELKYKSNIDLCFPLANVQDKMIYLVLNSAEGNELTIQVKGYPFVSSETYDIKGICIQYIGYA